jgi:uncharacterized protein (DUF302 family)
MFSGFVKQLQDTNSGILHVHDLKQTLQSKGIKLDSHCRDYDVCNPQAASKALNAMAVSTVLPCRISIFSDSQRSSIATVKPTDLLRVTGLTGVEPLAQKIEREDLAIIDGAA